MPEEKKPKNKGGRPTDYSPEMAKRICDLVATNGCGLLKLTKMHDDIPEKITINLWRRLYPEFSAQYAKAKLEQADILAEECLDISDEVSNDTRLDKDGNEVCNSEYINRSRLRVDTRKWLASKLLPKQYGEQKKIESLEGENEALKKQLLEMRAEMGEKYKKDY